MSVVVTLLLIADGARFSRCGSGLFDETPLAETDCASALFGWYVSFRWMAPAGPDTPQAGGVVPSAAVVWHWRMRPGRLAPSDAYSFAVVPTPASVVAFSSPSSP